MNEKHINTPNTANTADTADTADVADVADTSKRKPALPCIDAMDLQGVIDLAVSMGEKPYRGKQIYEWVHTKQVRSIDEMTSLSVALREKLQSAVSFTQLKLVSHLTSKIDGTTKFLFELSDGMQIESVMLADKGRLTACVSCQVGCRMGCTFCETAKMGLMRNLTAGEIIQQVSYLQKFADQYTEHKLSNIVFMGMGEPLDNVDAIKTALIVLVDPKTYNFSHRKITVSTSGLVSKIDALAEMQYPPTIAVSLHATTDAVRSQIMPINKAFPMEKLISKLAEITRGKKVRVTIEYIMLKGINDSDENARELAKIAHRFPCKINLIPYNEGSSTFQPTNHDDILNFQKYLMSKGFKVFIRKSLGQDIMGACGQLYANHNK